MLNRATLSRVIDRHSVTAKGKRSDKYTATLPQLVFADGTTALVTVTWIGGEGDPGATFNALPESHPVALRLRGYEAQTAALTIGDAGTFAVTLRRRGNYVRLDALAAIVSEFELRDGQLRYVGTCAPDAIGASA